MSKRRIIVFLLLVLLAVVLGIAWYDGGRQEQRLIVEPVDISEGNA